jgi:DNA-binding MarR family transcriptional regulator
MNQVPDPVDCPYYLISRATLAVTAILKKELTAAGVAQLRVSYLGVMLALWRQDDLQAGDLGRRAGLEPSTMTGVLDRMERDGLVVRQPDPKDRRAQRIVLTEAGQAVQPGVLAAIDATMTRVLEGLDEEEQGRLKQTLLRLLANTDKGIAP